jgi:hypothetical protein
MPNPWALSFKPPITITITTILVYPVRKLECPHPTCHYAVRRRRCRGLLQYGNTPVIQKN